MMEAFLGMIMIFGGNFAIRSWAMCDGQIIAISQNSALFSLLGTIYGGDGRTTFALPDLRGRAPIGFGHGPGLSSYMLGQRPGVETHTMTLQNMANHTHAAVLSDVSASGAINVTDTTGDTGDAANSYLAPASRAANTVYSATKTGTSTLAADSLTLQVGGGNVTVANAGGSVPFSLVQPSLAMNYLIALQGIFPSRN